MVPEVESGDDPPAASTKGTKLRRLVGFPLLLFYVLLLVVAAWPRLAQPTGGRATIVQLVALQLLHLGGIVPGEEVFTGRYRPRDERLSSCFRIQGIRADNERQVLFDNLTDCRNESVAVFKNPFLFYQDRMLNVALRHASDPRRHRNLNLHPLTHLFAISEYYCRQAPDVAAVSIERLLRTIDYETGERGERFNPEGTLVCETAQWRAQ